MSTHPPPSRPIRVARVIARLNVGGPARHVVWLSEALNDEGFQSILVAGSVPPGEDDMIDFATDHGVHPIIIKEMSRELSPRDFITVWKLFRLFLKFSPDIVHTHTAKAGATGRLAGLLYRLWSAAIGRPRATRFVHTFHGHVFHHYYGRFKTLLFLTIERTLARLATDRIIVLSEQQFHEIHQVFRVGRKEQFRIVPLGIDLAVLEKSGSSGKSVREELAIGRNDRVVGIVGRLVPVKNHEMFLRVASRFAGSSANPKIRFVIFGDGPDREKMERRHQELGLSGQTLFAGLREAADIYSSMDIAALTSQNEGTPLTLIEALAKGLPIVSTAVGGVVDVLGAVEHTELSTAGRFEIRQRGLTVAPDDVEGFVFAVNHLIEDGALRARFAERGPAYVKATYSKERLVRNMIQTYHELIDRAPVP